MRFLELRDILCEDEAGDAKTYEIWRGSTPISRTGRRYDGRLLRDGDMVRVWRVWFGKRTGRELAIHPGSWVTMNPDYLDEYAGRDWREKLEWVTAEIRADELVDAQTGGRDGDAMIFIPKEK